MKNPFKRRKDNGKKYAGAEMELMTNELIEQTIEKMKAQYSAEIDRYHSGDALERDVADYILLMLLGMGAADRKNLIGRIEKDIETGDLFDRYYSKMEVINYLTNSAYAKGQKMKRAQEKLAADLAIYKKLTGKLYEPHAIPTDADLKKGAKKDIYTIIKEMEKSAGEEVGNA